MVSLLIVGIWWYFLREKAGKPFPNALMKQYSHTPLPLSILWWIRAIMLALLSLILIDTLLPATGGSWPVEIKTEKETVITLDISKSMETDDIFPSRIEYAKSMLAERTLGLKQLWFIIFAGKTFVLSPITEDRTGLNYLIETLTTDTINQGEAETSGTNIWDALIQAASLFRSGTLEKQIILITDGRANIGLDPEIAAASLKEKNINLSIIALGSGSDIALTHLVDGVREPLYDNSGNTINGSVDIETLTRMASTTQGKLLHIPRTSPSPDLDSIFGPLVPVERDWISTRPRESTIALILALLGALHLLFSFFFWRKYKTP
jgi:Ca-activated chloride channel homolog